MALIEVRGLVKRFGAQTAVDGISFDVEEGEVFGLLGPNGAGKTTTIRILTTLIPPTAGEVHIAGLDLRREGPRLRQLFGYVPQNLSADGSLTGYENLLITAKLLGLPRAERERRIDETLRLLRLEEARDQLVQQYSGGMVRRLEVGQAILHRPRLLILDEPTVGLDPAARNAIWAMLGQLRRESGLTVLVTTHYMEEADAYCDRIAIMNHGRIAASGTPEELKRLVDREGATLEDVFTAVTGDTLESGGDFRELRRLRRRIQRFD
ncbi:MAG: ATP-binding cassette domain-containing protein [Firmicutes bacterium]|nr:ATP-binding cassette domain-containing protein [Bacillota bacterium]